MPVTTDIPERWLYWTYETPHWLTAPLRSLCGKQIRVIEPGVRNDDNGPDFCGALLEIEGVRCRGDVECHVTVADWYRHGHDEDRRYANVLLHLLWDAPDGVPASLAGRFPHVLVRQHLQGGESAWRAAMICREGVVPGGAGGMCSLETAARLAEQRFRRKVDRLAEWARHFSLDDVLWIALAEALGYAKNRFPFRQLLWERPPSREMPRFPPGISPAVGWWLYLALNAGWLTPPARDPLPVPCRRLVGHWQAAGVYPVLRRTDWYFARLRPYNSPFLRLGALAQLLVRPGPGRLFATLLDISRQRLPLTPLLRQWEADLCAPLSADLAELLQRFGGFQRLPRYLLGRTRRRQFLINAALPCLWYWATRSGNTGFRLYVEGLYEAFPGVEDPVLINRCLGPGAAPAQAEPFRRSGFYQQGLLEYQQAEKPGDRGRVTSPASPRL